MRLIVCVRQELERDVSCGQDYACVSHPNHTPGIIDRYLAAIYIWHFAHGVDIYPALID